VTSSTQPDTPAWLSHLEARLCSPRRIRAQAILLALCFWSVCAVDFATPGLFDRAGNIKFQDFLPFYISARLVAQNHAGDLYNQQVTGDEMQRVVQASNDRQAVRVSLPNLYGPQVALMFAPLSRFSFPTAALAWTSLSLMVYAGCIYLVWKSCLALRPYSALVAISALAFPPLFHFFVRGQISVVPLACFTAAYLAFRAQNHWLAGIALGFLVLKPQFLIAIPLILLLSKSWRAFAGLVLSAATQLILTAIHFGPAVMHAYFDTLWHTSRWITAAELSLAPIQMHSLRSFWTLLIPWPAAAFALYAMSSCIVVAIAAAIWRSSHPLALRFSALTLAAVLVNPHLFVYDLLVITPALLLLADWALANPPSARIRLLAYLAFILPLLGPLSRWTHLQLSVPIFFVLLWTLRPTETAGHKLDSNECRVV